jgi:hypothetical protein
VKEMLFLVKGFVIIKSRKSSCYADRAYNT